MAFLWTRTPSRLVQFLTPGEHISWASVHRQLGTQGFPGTLLHGGYHSYQAGKSTAHVWNNAVVGVEMNRSQDHGAGVARLGNALGVYVPTFSPSDRDDAVADLGLEHAMTQGSLTLSGGDHSVSADKHMSMFEGLPADERRYTLNLKAARDVSWSKLSPSVEATWTFKSRHVDGEDWQFQPLVWATVRGDLDEYNRARAFDWSSLRIEVGTQRRAVASPIRSVRLEVSHDDGKTWKQAWVRDKVGDNTWEAAVFNPRAEATSGYVSLRVKATAANGNTLEQTVIRAYGLTNK